MEILYCVPSGHLGLAIWILNECYAEGGNQVAVTLTPGTQGVLQIYLNGQQLYNKQAEHEAPPTPSRVQQMRQMIREKLRSASEDERVAV